MAFTVLHEDLVKKKNWKSLAVQPANSQLHFMWNHKLTGPSQAENRLYYS